MYEMVDISKSSGSVNRTVFTGIIVVLQVICVASGSAGNT
jgi:hypothetical protein